MSAAPAQEMGLEEFSRVVRSIEAEVARVIVGQKQVIRSVLICVLAGRHALLEGVPGLGKTQLIRTLADALDLKFSRIQFTPDLMPSDIVGTNILEDDEQGRKVFRFQQGPVFANLVLADEINRATPKTQSAMLEAMQEKTVTVAGKVYRLEAPFFVLATQNPLEMEGTYPLPEAQLDRFMFKVDVTFPTVDDLVTIMERTTSLDAPYASKVADGVQVIGMGRLALDTPIATHVSRYAAQLIVASHPENAEAPDLVKKYVRYGASPRGAQALILGAKINALLEGRFNVAFEDVDAVAPSALRHRLLLNFEGLAEGVGTDAIVADLVKTTPKVKN
ncbi:MAG: MoxR family ATPase [bacterium]|nr:MoxR family ATPase [bacterium]